MNFSDILGPQFNTLFAGIPAPKDPRDHEQRAGETFPLTATTEPRAGAREATPIPYWYGHSGQEL